MCIKAFYPSISIAADTCSASTQFFYPSFAVSDKQWALGPGKKDFTEVGVNDAETNIHAILQIIRISSQGLKEPLIKHFKNLRGILNTLLDHDVLQDVVTNDGHECARHPMSGTISYGNDFAASAHVAPKKVATHNMLWLADNKRVWKELFEN